MHRGLTSQDVIDTALVLCLRDALSRVGGEIATQVGTLAGLAERHHHTPMLARTLTQPALPSTVGMKVANWLSGVLDAADAVAALPPLPVQAGGAAGTLAAATELTGSGARPSHCPAGWPAVSRGRRALAHHPISDHCAGDALAHVATRGDTSLPTSRPAAGPRSANWPRGAEAVRLPCRTRTIRCCRC